MPENCGTCPITHCLCMAVSCLLTWTHEYRPININTGFGLPARAPLGSTEVNSMPTSTYATQGHMSSYFRTSALFPFSLKTISYLTYADTYTLPLRDYEKAQN